MFSEQQHATLRALVDRIIPPDEFLGGWEAGVGTYLERQFARDLRPLLDVYRAGLDALNGEALATAEEPFAALDAAAQDALLERVELGEVVALWPVEPVAFFRTVVEHVAEGYYSDPDNGGNRDQVAWQMIGFEVTQ